MIISIYTLLILEKMLRGLIYKKILFFINQIFTYNIKEKLALHN